MSTNVVKQPFRRLYEISYSLWKEHQHNPEAIREYLISDSADSQPDSEMPCGNEEHNNLQIISGLSFQAYWLCDLGEWERVFLLPYEINFFENQIYGHSR